MLTAAQFTDLIAPLAQRARPKSGLASKSFIDRAAGQALEYLDIPSSDIIELGRRPDAMPLALCERIDRHLNTFFAKYPKALGVEVSGGLSTRFHRLSESMDWPQFKWLSINHFDTDDCLQFVFSGIDNFSNVATVEPTQDWFRHIYWQDNQPKVVILGESTPFETLETLDFQLKTLASHHIVSQARTHLIFCHRVADFPQYVDRYHSQYALVAHEQIRCKHASGSAGRLFENLRERLFGPALYMTHLRLEAP